MSLKSPLDLEAVTRGRDEAMSPRNKSETEMASGSIQAALAALQAGQSSLNQVCKRILPSYEYIDLHYSIISHSTNTSNLFLVICTIDGSGS